MNKHLERQSELPKSIQLFRHAPMRQPFSWKELDPKKVRSTADLPPYLILGELDADSFDISPDGWSARWQGTEENTYFDVKYLADRTRYEIRQTWCGVDGGFSTYPSRIPLEKIIPQTLYMPFPSDWDRKAKENFEHKFQITVIEQPKEAYSFCGIPDGALRTIAFPVAVKNLRPVREWLQKLSSGLLYPISAEAKLLFQAINYIEGKAPEWTTTEPVLFKHSIDETGIVPYGFPVKETAKNGSAAWTLRRDVYVIFIGLPFACLADFLNRMATTNGPIRSRTDPVLRIELQPIVMPIGFEFQTKNITFSDKDQTTRCFWQFSKEGEDKMVSDVQSIIDGEAKAEDLLIDAETISKVVTEKFIQIFNNAIENAGNEDVNE